MNNNWNHRNIILEDTSQYLEEARGKKISDPLRAKLMGMEDIRNLKGTMTPRYFATKVMKYLTKTFPDKDLGELDNNEIQNAINIISNLSKPLATRSDIQITTRERGAAEKGLKKGDTGFETLQLNLGGDSTLKSEGEVGENDLYTIVKDGLKYRVTLNKFKGTSVNLDDITQQDIVSVVIVKPSEVETVDKFGGEIDLGQREKLVADYPEGEEHTEEENEVIRMHDKFYELLDKGDNKGAMDILVKIRMKSPEMYETLLGAFAEDEAEINTKKADLNKDGKISEYEKARGQAIADAMEKSSEKKEEESERCPVTGKLRKKSDEESCDEEDEQEVALSPQAINQMMVDRGRNEMHRHHQIERMFRHGY
jgi:hypothetical protein